MELNNIIIILHLLTLSWFITHFEPLLIKLLSINIKNEIVGKFISIITCWKCLSLWLSITYVTISLLLKTNELTIGFILIPFYVSMISYILENNTKL